MVKFRVNRDFIYKKDGDFKDFLEIVGDNISTKALFSTIAVKGTALLTKNALFNTAYLAVLAGDNRQLANRNKLRGELEVDSRGIADDVNELAAGDEVTITEAGFLATSTPSDQELGLTTLISVKYDPSTGEVHLRCKRATLAADYQIDVSTDSTTWEIGVDSMPLTNFYILWKKGNGKFFIRLCPRGKKGKRGTPSNFLPISIY